MLIRLSLSLLLALRRSRIDAQRQALELARFTEELATKLVVAGEDVGVKGGVYGVTQRLQQRFGSNRVIDTLLDEQSILGLALGAGVSGLLPLPEIQYLAYLHNAEDQLRGEAATLRYFSQGAYRNGMVVRIQGYGYQKGFGGHFHNDNSIAVLRDIPGVIIACPSTGADAAMMLRECVRLAREEQRVVDDDKMRRADAEPLRFPSLTPRAMKSRFRGARVTNSQEDS